MSGKIAIGKDITLAGKVFGEIFNLPRQEMADTEFDHLFLDGERISIGYFDAVALHVPDHTPADMAHIIGDAAFVGDTMFMPDAGTANADFPSGDASQLSQSARHLLSLHPETRLFLCYEYKAPGRSENKWESTFAQQRMSNIHVRDCMSEDDFV